MAQSADMLTAVDRMSRLLALVAIKGLDEGDAIGVLAKAGYSNPEIGRLLGMTSNAVNLRKLRSKGRSGKGRRPR